MEEISIQQLAENLNVRKQTIFRIAKRLGIEKTDRVNMGSRGQKVSFISESDANLIQDELNRTQKNKSESNVDSQIGVFYLIQLEPDFDPGRIKLGYASNIDERIRQHKTAAPLCKLIQTWPCKSLWEKTIMDCVTQNCEQLYTEVFRAQNIEDVILLCDKVFEMMPCP